MFANIFVEGKTVRRVSIIPTRMNGTAAYMASYGMQNMSDFVETPEIFGNLQNILNKDMGFALPMAILPNYGEGELFDAPTLTSPPSLYNENLNPMVEEHVQNAPGAGITLNTNNLVKVGHGAGPSHSK